MFSKYILYLIYNNGSREYIKYWCDNVKGGTYQLDFLDNFINKINTYYGDNIKYQNFIKFIKKNKRINDFHLYNFETEKEEDIQNFYEEN